MPYQSAAGMTFAFSTATGTGIAITAFSNAGTGAMTVGSGAVGSGDYFVYASNGWGIIEETIRRAQSVTGGTSVAVDKLNTTSTTKYPSGQGTGTLRVLSGTGWVPITAIVGQSQSGDEQSYETLTPIDKGGAQVNVPTTRSPYQITLTFSHNATAQGWYDSVKDLSESQTKAATRVVYPDGMRALVWGTITLQEGPQQEELNNPKGTLTINGFRTLYGS